MSLLSALAQAMRISHNFCSAKIAGAQVFSQGPLPAPRVRGRAAVLRTCFARLTSWEQAPAGLGSACMHAHPASNALRARAK
jgi:hypothetical protein